MSCNSYDSCSKRERENLGYPVDSESLYMNKIYDNQTANRRCYEKNPIDIVEGFGFPLSWEKILKFSIVVLLVILFVVLAKDFFMPKETVSINVPVASELKIETPTIAAAPSK